MRVIVVLLLFEPTVTNQITKEGQRKLAHHAHQGSQLLERKPHCRTLFCYLPPTLPTVLQKLIQVLPRLPWIIDVRFRPCATSIYWRDCDREKVADVFKRAFKLVNVGAST